MNGFTTKALHTGYKPNKEDGAIIPPLHLSSTFRFGNEGGFDYSRTINPTRIILEKTLAHLDGNTFGLAYSSGSAVLANIVALLKKEGKILFSSDAYGGTYRFIVNVAGNQGIKFKIVDLTDYVQTESILKIGGIKIIWVETPTNPLLKVVDISRLSKLAKKYKSILVVDNTFASPIIQQPAKLGADVVVYSTTKYINGHSDVIGGALTTSNKKLYTKLKFLQNAIGAILSPFDSWLTLRGLRTLELRMKRHIDNAEKIAAFLSKHKKIKKVYYPGLFIGEQKKIVAKQMKRPGGMLSIEIKEKYNVKKFLTSLKYFPLAESLGGVESLIDHPASMTHASIPKKEREKIGLSNSLLRISVGIENIEDLIADLRQALNKI
ncbi:cystathionine gamma-synthase [Candidatus Roizmanbacteria bacterium CG03_land_8_20_14_0_80_35_26]|uniref:Cystathionine gamma-synthase n=1 Tax=Candidatus Roizmanbacteria bacterium CG03_land_8_20_14_0_80_35_26 TaxID=1974845 RepID=A0A2M7BXW6_9BACT|nr:MAG: cystathionine gamma-synthase [Candidatus Roizmanbacteria bacterium CG03_land_8_20_14_0_80_35_26]